MAAIPHVYTDAALTTAFDDATMTLEVSAINGSSGDAVLYFGTPTETNQIQATSDPGVDPILISIADSDELTGPDATDIKLAITSGGLATAVAGDPLSLGATVSGGAANAIPIYVRWTNATGTGEYTDISLTITDRQETAV